MTVVLIRGAEEILGAANFQILQVFTSKLDSIVPPNCKKTKYGWHKPKKVEKCWLRGWDRIPRAGLGKEEKQFPLLFAVFSPRIVNTKTANDEGRMQCC